MIRQVKEPLPAPEADLPLCVRCYDKCACVRVSHVRARAKLTPRTHTSYQPFRLF